MDIYLSGLVLGGLGLGAMAVGGLSHSGQGHGHAHASGHAHAGHTHGGHSQAAGHGHSHTHAHDNATSLDATRLLAWPRVLFGFVLGLGATGIALKPFLFEPVTFAAAVLGGLFFQRFIITPLWDFSFRFASQPALTSESADEAIAVTSFNAQGEGLVSLEVDGQLVQVLGQLRPTDRSLGIAVRAGQRLHVEEVNTSNNRCIVSAI